MFSSLGSFGTDRFKQRTFMGGLANAYAKETKKKIKKAGKSGVNAVVKEKKKTDKQLESFLNTPEGMLLKGVAGVYDKRLNNGKLKKKYGKK